MASVSHRQLSTPPAPKALLSRQARAAQVATAQVAHVPSVQFGGAITNISRRLGDVAANNLEKVFQNIVEIFLWAFIAQDVVSMWVPRIEVSLTRGRVHYDPTTDPSNQGLTPRQQMAKSLVKNIKGLNWPNLYEETMREVATGPGVLMVPTVIYSIARRTFGKQASEMGYQPLSKMAHTFMDHLKGADSKKLTQKHAYTQSVQSFVRNLFQDTEFEKAKLASGQSGKAFLDNWSGRWAEQLFNNDHSTRDKALGELSHELTTAVEGFNRKHPRMAELLKTQTDVTVTKVRLFKRAAAEKAGKAAVFKPSVDFIKAGDLTGYLTKFNDFMRTVYEEKVGKHVGDQFAALANKIYHRLTVRKAIMGLSATLLTGIYLTYLVKLTQHNDSYVANRLLTDDPSKPAQKPTQNIPARAEAKTVQAKTDEAAFAEAMKELEAMARAAKAASKPPQRQQLLPQATGYYPGFIPTPAVGYNNTYPVNTYPLQQQTLRGGF
ncbi:MAG: hypothetical protein K2X01_09300 [Cyanobacteria bacterium]|nr:hypothetical protein [Cyanobacteriota bacterium]